jgi:hypothetical protein
VTTSTECPKTSRPVAGAPSYATLSESACSYVPSVSMTTIRTGASPSASVLLWPPASMAIIESNVLIPTGRPSACQRSKMAISQSAYSASASVFRAGRCSQVACGSRKSIRGGSRAASDS